MITQVEVALTAQFKAIYDATSAASGVPVDWPGKKTDAVNGKIIRVRFGHVPKSVYAQLGGGRVRRYGSLLIQICLPTGSGKGELLAIADAFISGFHLFRQGGLRCNPASYSDGVEESGFITGTVDVPFISDYSS
jgi:hypothetical protein